MATKFQDEQLWSSDPNLIRCNEHPPGYHKYFGDPRQDACSTMRLEWYNERGQLHREDEPAVICSDGMQVWYRNGKLHREDGPAVIWPSHGSEEWYRNGKFHREDGPAVIYPDGTQKWYRNGKVHREDGPAIIWSDGTEEWWLNGEQLIVK